MTGGGGRGDDGDGYGETNGDAPIEPAGVKRLALELLLEAWDKARERGAAPETVATAAIFAALTDMIDIHGEEAVARMAESLPQRIRSGEFTLARNDD